MQKKHFQDWITLVVGLWLIAFPFVQSIAPPEGATITLLTANFVLSGLAAVILAVAALFYFQQWEEWLDVALGIWIIVSPWVLGYTFAQVAVWNAVACGIVIAVMGGWTTFQVNRRQTQ